MKNTLLFILGICFLPCISKAENIYPPQTLFKDTAAIKLAVSAKLGNTVDGDTTWGLTEIGKGGNIGGQIDDGTTCIANYDCDTSQRCIDGTCQNLCTSNVSSSGTACVGTTPVCHVSNIGHESYCGCNDSSCVAGNYCATASNDKMTCQVCPANTTSYNNRSCNCPSGQVANGSGGCKAANPCEPNPCSSSPMTTCTVSSDTYICSCTSTECGTGKKCINGSCGNCSAGESCNCPSGQLSNGNGTCVAQCTATSQCGTGYYCSSSICQVCPSGSASCNCPEGTLPNGNGVCTNCAAGATNCGCPTGQVADGNGACITRDCSGYADYGSCPLGYRCDASTYKCVPCGTGSNYSQACNCSTSQTSASGSACSGSNLEYCCVGSGSGSNEGGSSTTCYGTNEAYKTVTYCEGGQTKSMTGCFGTDYGATCTSGSQCARNLCAPYYGPSGNSCVWQGSTCR